MVFCILWWLSAACASDTEGRISEDIEVVIALGNNISGRAIPEKMPYMDNAFEASMPFWINFCGIIIVSKVDSRLMHILFKLIGVERVKSSWVFFIKSFGEFILLFREFFNELENSTILEKQEEANSPANKPIHTNESEGFALTFWEKI